MAGSLKVEVAYEDRMILPEILEPDDKRYASGETSNEIAEDTEIVYQGARIKKGLDTPEVANFVLQFGSGVSASLVGAWLYDRLQDKAESVSIGGEEVDIDEDSIQSKLEDYMDR